MLYSASEWAQVIAIEMEDSKKMASATTTRYLRTVRYGTHTHTHTHTHTLRLTTTTHLVFNVLWLVTHGDLCQPRQVDEGEVEHVRGHDLQVDGNTRDTLV
jgi:hypothetical protein